MTRVKITPLPFCANSKQLIKYFRNFYIIWICFLGGCSYSEKPQPTFEVKPEPPTQEKPPKPFFKETIPYTQVKKPPVPKISLKINSLLGKDKKFIIVLLGKPKFLRHDPPSEIWRYTTKFCILDFFAYLPKINNAPKVYRVKFYEARTPKGKEFPESSCLDTIYKNYGRQSKK